MTFRLLVWLLCASWLSGAFAADGRLNVDGISIVHRGSEELLGALIGGLAGYRGEPKTATFRQLLYEGGCDGLLFKWYAQGELKNGAAFARAAEELNKARKVFDCRGSTCLAVIPSITLDQKERAVPSLSVCEVVVVGKLYGPPGRCKSVVKHESTTMVKGIAGPTAVGCAVGLRDFDAIFEDRAGDLLGVRALVGEVLKSKPFNLTVMQEGDALLGTRAHLPSEVLRGWREWVTVRVDVGTRDKKNAGASIYTTILVSKQNTADRESWTLPSDQQESAYLTALRNEFVKRGGVLGTGNRR
jgi:hypothetical protein